jgi:hypothetical protein
LVNSKRSFEISAELARLLAWQKRIFSRRLSPQRLSIRSMRSPMTVFENCSMSWNN